MAGSTQPFRASGTLTLAASTTPSSGTLSSTGHDTVVVQNASSGTAFINITGQTASVATDVPVLSGMRLVLHCPSTVNTVSVVLSAGTGTVYFTAGYGTP